MRKGALAFVLLLAGTASAQEKLDPRLRGLLARPTPSSGFTLQGLMPDPAVDRVSVFVRLLPGADLAALRARFPAGSFGPPAGDVVTAVLGLSDVARLASDPAVFSAHGARPVRLMMDIARSSVQTGGIWLGAIDAVSLDFGTTLGSGVVAGFVDSGIDYKHADFYTEGSPNKTRVLAIWDQNDAGGPAPGGFTKGGSHWTRAQIEAEISASPPGVVRHTDTDGHGTHVAGIAAGDGSSTDGDLPAGTFKGIAPEADIVMVESDLSDTGISEGIQFILQKAAAAGKRAVINLSLGSQYGPHDGTGALDVAVGNVAASTPVVVAMGNEQANGVHASTTVVASGSALFTLTQTGQTLVEADFWVPSGDFYTVSVATSATGSSVQCLPGSDCAGASALSLAGNTVEIYNTAGSHPSGDREMLVDISRGAGLTSTAWRITLTRQGNGGSGRIDGWMVTSGASFTSLTDSSGTISSPATANSVIAVGSYCSKRTWVANDNLTYVDNSCPAGLLGDASAFSNHGPTRDGRQKPDVSAPGQRIASALSANISEAVATTAKDGRHRLVNGTSMATPVVAGAVVRSLQSSPGLTAAAARSALQGQARSDAKVTAHGAVPNFVFGYGKLNILGCGDNILSAPAAAVPTVLGTSSISWTWAALSGAASYSVAYASSPGVVVGSTGNPVYVQTALSANTTTAIRVFGVNPCGTGPGQDSASTSTLSIPLGSFVGVPHVSSATAVWTPLAAAPRAVSSFGYRFEASTSPAFLPGTVFSSATSAVGDGSLTVTGLTSFATYYLRVGTLNEPGGPNYVTSASVFTQTLLGPPAVGTFTVHSPTVIEASWDLGPNPAGLIYEADASTASNFTGTVFSSQTYALSAVFSGLSVNTTYHFRVHATTGPYAALGSTATLANVPAALAAPFSGVFQTSMTFLWTANGNPAGTRWLAEVAADTGFTIAAQSSNTAATSLLVTSGLLKHATYYARVRALNRNGVPTDYLATAATATLTDPPGALASHFLSAGASSVTVAWGSLGLNNCDGYRVEASSAANFSGVVYGARTAYNDCTQSSLVLQGLAQDSTLYFRVGALNWNSRPVFINAGSTRTLGVVSSSSTIQPGETLVITHIPSVAELTSMRVVVPVNSLPVGATVTVLTTFLGGLPAPVSSQGRITLLGAGAGADISAGGAQPQRPVTISFSYLPAALPAGTDVRRIVIGRHTGSGWTLLPSTVDAAANTVTAQTSHFSVFAPLVATPGTSLDSVQAFPIPWKPGSGDPQFDAQGISFTNLPEGGEIRIMTILGEEVKTLNAGPSGMALWNGVGSGGIRVGSGTYLVVVSGAGSRKVLRVAVVR